MSAEERRVSFGAQSLAARVVSGVILGLVAVAAAWRGGWLLDILLAVVILAGLAEYLNMAAHAGHAVFRRLGFALGAAALLVGLVPELPAGNALLVLLALVLATASLRPPIEGRVVGLALTALGVLYVVGLGLALRSLRLGPGGRELLLAVLLATWAADTLAFFVGIRWGKRRLAPAVSPAKSVEGLLAGSVSAVLVSLLILGGMGSPSRWTLGLAVGLAVAVGAPLGDLFESLLKRNFQVKDTSQLIPGHGGVLDRVDGLLVAGALAAAVAQIFES